MSDKSDNIEGLVVAGVGLLGLGIAAGVDWLMGNSERRKNEENQRQLMIREDHERKKRRRAEREEMELEIKRAEIVTAYQVQQRWLDLEEEKERNAHEQKMTSHSMNLKKLKSKERIQKERIASQERIEKERIASNERIAMHQQGVRSKKTVRAQNETTWRVKVIKINKYEVTVVFNTKHGNVVKVPTDKFFRNFKYVPDDHQWAVMNNEAGHDTVARWLKANGRWVMKNKGNPALN